MTTYTKQQVDAVEKTFNNFAAANKKYNELHTAYMAEMRLPGAKDKLWAALEISMSRDPQKQRQAFEGLYDNQRPIVQAYIDSTKAADAFRSARAAVKGNKNGTEIFIEQVDALSKTGRLATFEKDAAYRKSEGGTFDLAKWAQENRKKITDAEKAEADAAVAAKAKAEGIESLKETTRLVTSGTIINIDGNSKNHEAARVEVAKALERYFADPNTLDADARNKLGLADDTKLSLVDDEDKITNRPLLGKALRVYQEKKGIVSDGKVGQTTLAYLLAENGAGAVGGRVIIDQVSQTNGNKSDQPGYLCTKLNPCELRDYTDNDKDHRDAQKRVARDSLRDVEKLFKVLKEKVGTQEVDAAKGYTQQEHDKLKALFAVNGDQPAPIDTDNTDYKISKDHIKAFQRAFGLKVDGVIGEQTAHALMQVELRLVTDQVVDPSEVSAAVMRALPPKPKAAAAPAK